MDRSWAQYSAALPQPVIEKVVMTFDFPEVSFHHDAGEELPRNGQPENQI
jgi:hypothetical protein